MTDKEHALMMMMFTRQALYVQMLLDMLKSNGIIEGHDVPAFDSIVISDPDSISAFERTDAQYRVFAKRLGLALPELPPSPESKVQPQ